MNLIEEYKSNIIYFSEIIPEMKKSILDIEQELINSKKELKILDESKDMLNILKNHKLESKKDFILNIINTALNDVFGQNVKIDIEATASKGSGKINMKYDIVLYQNDIEMARNEKLLVNNGGGVLSFISILFKILVGYIYSNNKFFLFDESISQVSPLYRPRLAQFFKEFCTQYNFTIVLISQTDDIDEYADLVYLLDGEFAKDGTPILKINKKIGVYPEDDYIYSKIKNFQSIVDLEFRYKGFVVVRGNNNIGKSASFRAINSLLFNSFDAKDHPRKNKKRGALTEIEFGKYSSKEEKKEIRLIFKSNKVIYEFDGKTYAGKKLAFEKIKDKIEQIGFKYVNIKEIYKNFRGTLKDQTERLAVTTQYDGFYLVGNKANETDKVFNFLFDSANVANALVSVNNDINILNQNLNELSNKLQQTKSDLERKEIEYQIVLLKYYIRLIQIYIENKQQLKKFNEQQEIIDKYILLISKKLNIDNQLPIYLNNKNELNHLNDNNIHQQLDIIDEIINISSYTNSINQFLKLKIDLNISIDRDRSISNDIEIINTTIQRIEKIEEEIKVYKYYIDTFDSYFNNTNSINSDKNKINNLNNLILKIDEYIDLVQNSCGKNDIISILNKIKITRQELNGLKNSYQNILNSLNNLPKEFNIQECSVCGGIGYTKHNH